MMIRIIRVLPLHVIWIVSLSLMFTGNGIAWGEQDEQLEPLGRQKIGDTEDITIQSPDSYSPGIGGPAIAWSEEISKKGATFVRVHFSPDTVIPEGDELIILDSEGTIAQSFSGKDASNWPDRWSTFIPGELVTVQVIADENSTDGFVGIDRVAWGTQPLFSELSVAGSAYYSICSTTNPERIRIADPVAELLWIDDCGDSYSCTGWLFSPLGHFMTNAHCANSQSEANNSQVWFNHMSSLCDRPDRTRPDIFAGDITFIHKNCDLDYSVLMVNDFTKGNPAGVYGYFEIDKSVPSNGQPLWIPQHPHGLVKQIAEGCSVNAPTVLGFNGCHDPDGGPREGCFNDGFRTGIPSDVMFNCAIDPGSSGSPVLTLNNKVIAIAHAEDPFDDTAQIGVRMSHIAGDIPNSVIAFRIEGPDTVAEETITDYAAIVDNLIPPDLVVTDQAEWSVDDPTAGTIDEFGTFTANTVDTNRSTVIRATYNVGIIYEAQKAVQVLNTHVDTLPIGVTLIPSVDPENLVVGQSFSVDVALSVDTAVASATTDGDNIFDVRHLQFDVGLTTGADLDAFNWIFEELTNSGSYFLFTDGNVHSATYTDQDRVENFIVDLDTTPEVVARMDLTFTGDGRLNLLGVVNPSTPEESIRFQAGFDIPIIEFTQQLGNVTGGTLAVSEGEPLMLISSIPPHGAIDAGQTSDPDGSNPAGWQTIEMTFNGDISGMAPTDFEVTQQGGIGDVPEVEFVTPVDLNTVEVELNIPINPGAWTTITHLPGGSSVRLGYLPADVNADRTSDPLDILVTIDSLNGVVPLPLRSVDVNRSGEANAQDILRVIDLLNGAGVYDIWNGVSLPTPTD